MVQIGKSAEELGGSSHLVSNDHAALTSALDLEDLDDRAMSRLDIPHHLLVDVEGVTGRAVQECLVRHLANVGLARGLAFDWLVHEVSLGDKVASQLL